MKYSGQPDLSGDNLAVWPLSQGVATHPPRAQCCKPLFAEQHHCAFEVCQRALDTYRTMLRKCLVIRVLVVRLHY